MPLPTSSDSLPDKSIVRSKLGVGGIVGQYGSMNDNLVQGGTIFWPWFGTFATNGAETTVRSPMILPGRVKKIKMISTSNTLNVNAPITIRKNGVDIVTPFTFTAGQNTTKNADVDVAFLVDDEITIKATAPAGAGGVIFAECWVIEFDG